MLLQEVSAIKIPRFIGISDHDSVFQVLVFCDASTKSCGAAVYLLYVLSHLVASLPIWCFAIDISCVQEEKERSRSR